MTEDERRELEKVYEAVSLASTYHAKTNEANAALHKSGQVLYSPLTVGLLNARNYLARLLYNEV